jgi:MFS family permease
LSDTGPLIRATPEPAVETPVSLRGRLLLAAAQVAVDASPLRDSRQFRLLFIGQGVSYAGTMITYVALPFQAFQLTHSSLVVGLLSLAEFVPILLIAFVSGAIADAVDRLRMVRLTELSSCLVVGALIVNATLAHAQLWVLFVAASVAAALDALQRPSLDALVPRLVSREKMAAAAGLESLRGNLGHVAGPPVAGVLIATIGLPVTYGVDAATFGVSLIALLLMRPVPRASERERVSIASIRAGLGFAWRRKDLLGTYLVDMNAMFFGMPIALFPQIAAGFGGPAVLGVLYASPSIGALLAAVTSGWVRSVRRHGRAIVFAAAAWGAAIVGFGLSPALWLAVLTLAAAGAADEVSGLFRLTMWNQTIPDSLRGRLAGIEMISYTSGPTLGNVEAGVVASLAGVRTSVVSGGVLCVIGTAALAAALPQLWNYRADLLVSEFVGEGGFTPPAADT